MNLLERREPGSEAGDHFAVPFELALRAVRDAEVRDTLERRAPQLGGDITLPSIGRDDVRSPTREPNSQGEIEQPHDPRLDARAVLDLTCCLHTRFSPIHADDVDV